jgi:peroxiredoxin
VAYCCGFARCLLSEQIERMNLKIFTALAIISFPAASLPLRAAENSAAAKAEASPSAKSPPLIDLENLVAKVRAKIDAGKKTEQDLADELKQFDALLDKYSNEKTDDVAEILLIKAMVYLQVFNDADKGVALLKKVKSDFPSTREVKSADDILATVEAQKAARPIQKELAVGKQFPDFTEKDLDGKDVSVARYKGKIVLVDFWATWCGPCVAELPHVLKTYEKYHSEGFEIIGISLDEDKSKVSSFLKQKNMKWQQVLDGKENKLARKYGVTAIPATYLLDGAGKIVAKDLGGDALAQAVGSLINKK